MAFVGCLVWCVVFCVVWCDMCGAFFCVIWCCFWFVVSGVWDCISFVVLFWCDVLVHGLDLGSIFLDFSIRCPGHGLGLELGFGLALW